jgi:hypothetical protein
MKGEFLLLSQSAPAPAPAPAPASTPLLTRKTPPAHPHALYPRGKIVSKARPADALDGPPLSINRPAAEQGQVNDETYSDSDSDVSFGGNDAEAQGFGADGVPLEKYKALEEKLIALMKKTTAQKKDFKSIRKEHRKASNEAKHLKMERDELEQEVEEYQIKYEEALLKVGTGGGGGGGGGGAGGAALEEQRRKQREEARKALFAGGDEDDDVDFHVKLEDINFIKEVSERRKPRPDEVVQHHCVLYSIPFQPFPLLSSLAIIADHYPNHKVHQQEDAPRGRYPYRPGSLRFLGRFLLLLL